MVRLTLMKDHDVSSHSPYVDSVLCSANIICCVIDAHDLVMVDAIVFEENVFWLTGHSVVFDRSMDPERESNWFENVPCDVAAALA